MKHRRAARARGQVVVRKVDLANSIKNGQVSSKSEYKLAKQLDRNNLIKPKNRSENYIQKSYLESTRILKPAIHSQTQSNLIVFG